MENHEANKEAKGAFVSSEGSSDVERGIGEITTYTPTKSNKFSAFIRKLDSYGVEARGIERVSAEERSPQNWVNLCLIWASAGLTLTSLSTGLLGPLYYNLSFNQTCGIIWGAGALGSCCSAWMATYGKRNGLRALCGSRFVFGWFGAMLMAFLNGFTEVSYGIIDLILGGQALRTVSKDTLPLSAGIVIIGLVSWIVASGGHKFIHRYSSVAFILPLIAFIILFAKEGHSFVASRVPEVVDSATQSGFNLSFFMIMFGSYSGWIPVSADYYIYFAESTPNWKIFTMSFLGTWVLPSFAGTCGAGYGSLLAFSEEWSDLYEASGDSSTALVAHTMESFGNGRYFFVFVLGWTLITNNIFNLYSIGLSVQVLGDWALKVPRFIWTFCAAVLIIVLAVVGRNSFSTVLSNTMALIGYWTIAFMVVFVIEFEFFRRKFKGADLDAWNDRKLLPVGAAATLAFLIGIVGAILGMCQTWYIGVIAEKIGMYGGDLGLHLSIIFAGVTYPILRMLEIKKFGR